MLDELFIIGGSGFVGKNIVKWLYGRYSISVFDKFIDNTFFVQYPNVRLYKMELDSQLIASEVGTPDYIVNLTSIVTAVRELSLFDSMIQSNLKVLLNLFERFKYDNKLKLFVQFGSSEEYGMEKSPFVETMREQPSSPYALVKQLTTNTAMMLHKNYGFPIMVVRPGNLFGPMQNNDKFIPYVIEQLRQNKPLNVTPCEQKRDFIYVGDLVWIIEQLLQHYDKAIGEVVNVSSGESVSLKEIIESIKDVMHSTSVVNYGALPYRENEMMDLKCDISKLKKIIGKEIKFNIQERINKMLL